MQRKANEEKKRKEKKETNEKKSKGELKMANKIKLANKKQNVDIKSGRTGAGRNRRPKVFSGRTTREEDVEKFEKEAIVK